MEHGLCLRIHVMYEMFLDTEGSKISKSKGNVFTPQKWLKYGSSDSLILFMLKRFTSTRKISYDLPQKTMLELDRLLDVYHKQKSVSNDKDFINIKGLLEYVYKLDSVPERQIPFGLILSLSSAAPKDNQTSFINSRLLNYGYDEDQIQKSQYKLIYAINWVQDFGIYKENKIQLQENEILGINILIKKLLKVETSDQIQHIIYESSKESNIKLKKFFPILYNILIGRNEGPRIGPLINDLGIERVIDMLKSSCKQK